MNQNLSFKQYLFVATSIVLGLGTQAMAGWHCSPGQPAACIDQVNGYNKTYQQNLEILYERRRNTTYAINQCWEEYSRYRASYGSSPSREKRCRDIEDYHLNQLPKQIETNENGLNTNLRFLKSNGCRDLHCDFMSHSDT